MSAADRWFISMWMCSLASMMAKSDFAFWWYITFSVLCAVFFHLASKHEVRN